MMAEITLAPLPSHEELFQEYDQQRRLALNRVILPLFMLLDLLGIVAVVFMPGGTAYVQLGPLYFVEIGIFVALFGLILTAYILTNQRRVRLGTSLGIISVTLSTSFSQVFNLIGGQRGSFLDILLFTAFGIAIVMAGAVGTRRAIVGVTLWLNAVTVGSLLYIISATPPQAVAHHQAQTLIVQELIYQWALAGLMLGVLTGYRHVVRDLGDMRYAVEQAKQLDKLKNQFISSVNHELRNPIMAVQGYVETLWQSIKHHKAYAELEDLAARANRAGDDLADLVRSVLEIRQLDRGARSLSAAAVPVLAALDKAAGLIDPREGNMVERNLCVHIPEGLAIWGDRIRFQQILTNLLSNAIKYSPAGTPVEVAAHVVAETPTHSRWRRVEESPMQWVEISVRDNGLGIPPEQIPLLFQRFVRLPRDLASNVIGNGLGLYLCKGLAETMGGRIWVESDGVAGKGSTFYLRLPLPPVTAWPCNV
ncbi:MAG TPA: HAMP domain-containing sensor histidine kinase [Ktedonobacterales bacterium]|nr:HAMP domain-containing sensor histidine kinase [Ktedonobacterales bacterium]